MFAPVIALMGRFSFSTKFALTALVSFMPIAFLLFLAIPPLVQNYDTTQREVEGLTLLEAMQKVLIAAQKHRGLSAAWLSGDAAAEPKVKDVAVEMENALAGLMSASKAGGNAFAEEQGFKDLAGMWAPLGAQGADTPPARSFADHTALVNTILDQSLDLAYHSGLTLDPEAASYFLQDIIVNQTWPLMETLGKIRGKASGILARKVITPEEKTQVTVLTAQAQVYMKNMVTALDHALDGAPGLKEKLVPLSEAAQEAIKESIDTAMKEVVGDGFGMAGTEFFGIATRPITATLAFTNGAAGELRQSLEARLAKNRAYLWGGLVFIVAMLAIAGVIVMGMLSGILTAVREVNATTTALAAGDLTREARVGYQDELGRIAGDVNNARGALARMIQSAKAAAEDVAEASRHVADGSRQIAQSTNVQSESISAAAASVEELTVSVTHTADQTLEANATAAEAGRMSEQGRVVANQASREMAVVAQAVRDAGRQIEGLNARTEEISGIVQVIKDIADQTNLLALNAAIEAARAGEQGRGFAVVADEVRKLAERTSNATTEIGATISAIQEEARQAVASMESSSQRAEDGEHRVGETARVLDEIYAATENVRGKVDEIANASGEQRSASTEIAQSVERIAQMVEKNSGASVQVSKTADQLGGLAAQLKKELDHFKV